jgi:hypothetical protein
MEVAKQATLSFYSWSLFVHNMIPNYLLNQYTLSLYLVYFEEWLFFKVFFIHKYIKMMFFYF